MFYSEYACPVGHRGR